MLQKRERGRKGQYWARAFVSQFFGKVCQVFYPKKRDIHNFHNKKGISQTTSMPHREELLRELGCEKRHIFLKVSKMKSNFNNNNN